MGCPALGIWVAFLKQPDALPGRAPQKNKKLIFLNYFWFICDFFINHFYFLEFLLKNFFLGVLYQAVRAVLTNRPKYPMLDIPFKGFKFFYTILVSQFSSKAFWVYTLEKLEFFNLTKMG
jgi:hypothetical protein